MMVREDTNHGTQYINTVEVYFYAVLNNFSADLCGLFASYHLQTLIVSAVLNNFSAALCGLFAGYPRLTIIPSTRYLFLVLY